MNKAKSRLTFILLLLMVSACSEANKPKAEQKKSEKFRYEMPEQLNDGWLVGHLDDFQINSSYLEQLSNDIISGKQVGIDSISIVKNNTLLFHENYRTELTEYDRWANNAELNRHVMHSTSKSFASALVGIAIDQGYIDNVSVPLLGFFDYPEYDNWTAQKQQLTLENVLTMQLGLAWDEWTHPFGDERNSLTAISENHYDFVKGLLDLPLESPPGEKFVYNTIASVTLGLVVEKASAIPMEDFAQIYLFDPLQIDQANWLMTPSGYPNAGSGLVLWTRDMAKLGQLYLDKGQWNGLQVISPEWVERSISEKADVEMNYTNGYGYQWWLGDFVIGDQKIPFFSSRGFGGQFIVVVPQFDLVVAVTAHNYDNDLYELPFQLIEQYILPALKDTF